MKVKITSGTTYKGKPVKAGDVIDVDVDTYNAIYKPQNQAVPYVEPEPATDPGKKPAGGK